MTIPFYKLEDYLEAYGFILNTAQSKQNCDIDTIEIKNPSDENDAFIEALNQEISGDDKKLQVATNEAGNKCLMVKGGGDFRIKSRQDSGIKFP